MKEGELSARLGVDGSTLGGVISGIRRTPAAYEELIKGGFLEQQIPAWFTRLAKLVTASKVGVPEEMPALKPASTPVQVGVARKTGGTEEASKSVSQQVSQPASQPGSPGTLQNGENLGNSGNVKFMQDANEALRKQGQHMEPLGSDPL